MSSTPPTNHQYDPMGMGSLQELLESVYPQDASSSDLPLGLSPVNPDHVNQNSTPSFPTFLETPFILSAPNSAPAPRDPEVMNSTPRPQYVSDVFKAIAAPQILREAFPNADTLVILDLPFASERGVCQGGTFPLKLRLPFDSVTLRNSGLDLLPKLLDNERYQNSQQRTLKRAGEAIGDQYRYFLDLGPSSDEELRSEQLATLSLPEGVIRWSLMADRYGAPYCIAGGHDDICCCGKDGRKEDKEAPRLTSGFWETPLEKFRQIDDYSEARHITTVVRLLLALAGRGLELNSAARVYTLAGLAKMFDIRQAKVYEDDAPAAFADLLRTNVYDWFSEQTTIIEMLPEVMFTIGYNMKIATITQTAFRILVAEEAVMSEDSSGLSKGPRPNHSPFGRKLGDLDDDIMTTIEHATKSFKEQTTHFNQEITSLGFLNKLGVPEYNNLKSFGKWIFKAVAANPPSSYLTSLEEAYKSLKEAIDLNFLNQVKYLHPAVWLNSENQGAISQNVGLKDNKTVTLGNLLKLLSPNQKCMTAAYWRAIANSTPATPSSKVTNCSAHMYSAYQKAYENGLVGRFMPGILGVPNNPSNAAGKSGAQPETEATGSGDIGGIEEPLPEPFDPRTLSFQVKLQLHDLVQPMYVQDEYEVELPIRLPLCVYLLLGLHKDQFNFLPLWAGGNDDGTGGVFATSLPTARLGPVGPGPAYTTGLTVASEGGFEHLSQAGATTVGMNSSAVVQDGVSTVYDRRRVLCEEKDIVEEEEGFEGVGVSDGEEDIYGVSDSESETGEADAGKGQDKATKQDEDGNSIMEQGSDDDDDDHFGNENHDDDDGDLGNENHGSDEPADAATDTIAQLGLEAKGGETESGDGSAKETSDGSLSIV